MGGRGSGGGKSSGGGKASLGGAFSDIRANNNRDFNEQVKSKLSEMTDKELNRAIINTKNQMNNETVKLALEQNKLRKMNEEFRKVNMSDKDYESKSLASSILTSLTIYGSTLSFNAFIPSRARVHLSKLFALYHLAYLLKVTSVEIFSAFFSFRIYCVNDIALPTENLFGDKSIFKNILISFSLRLVL